jgi:hypothetical protein
MQWWTPVVLDRPFGDVVSIIQPQPIGHAIGKISASSKISVQAGL